MDLSILQWAVGLRTPFLDRVMFAVTNLGSETFYLLVLTVIYWCISKSFGYALGQVVVISDFMNTSLKALLRIPRPAVKWPGQIEVQHAETGPGYGFPSGHTQGATSFWTQLSTGIRRWWFTAAAVFLFALIGFSRIYLAVHSPSDVFGGLFLGLAVVVVVGLCRRLWERRVHLSYRANLALAFLFPLALLPLNFNPTGFKSAGLLLGIMVGWQLEERHVQFDVRAGLLGHVLKALIGLAGLFAIRIGLKPVLGLFIPEIGFLAHMIGDASVNEAGTLAVAIGGFLRYGAMGLYGIYIAPVLFKALGLSAAKTASDRNAAV